MFSVSFSFLLLLQRHHRVHPRHGDDLPEHRADGDGERQQYRDDEDPGMGYNNDKTGISESFIVPKIQLHKNQ